MLGLMTTPQAELLKTLYELEQQLRDGRYWRPRDLGAFRSSHHAMTLRKLVEQGLVERQGESGNFGYRIAQAGRSAWNLVQATSKLPSVAFIGGAAVQSRVMDLARLAA
ncbi:hypothetical protein WDL1P1_00915 (plasmid) [Variovorax sp. WDL1]|uniref:hypothetical protein n=2 Tax=Variovorax TaxID=34072 RepID=UPI00076CE4CD|nr:hypothetical protein [Variovorax sp. WDL1]KWT98351.1 hypothetical protein APY03_0486 [Variovorax sp. WDL1]VTU41660.1 hypothetical protein H6P1_00020 [Variovorax sp. PBL-H6]VTV18099.1 hypothetical protein WDL1P1_00915 [Variovorax sp. WDL1]